MVGSTFLSFHGFHSEYSIFNAATGCIFAAFFIAASEASDNVPYNKGS